MVGQRGRSDHLPQRFVQDRNCWLPPFRSGGRVRVVYGADDERIEGLVGITVAQARHSVAAPFNIPTAAVAFVNGMPAERSRLLRCDDHLEFVLPHGQKGMNRLLTRRQIEQEYGLSPRLLEELCRSVTLADTGDAGPAVYLESTVDDWMKERFADRPRQAQAPDSPDPFMTIRDVARLIVCSYTEARERMLDGRIRAIKDGRWLRSRRTWVEEYVANKTIKQHTEQGTHPVPVPVPRRRRKSGVKVKVGGIGHRFLEERAK